jgi:hypothetical protein
MVYRKHKDIVGHILSGFPNSSKGIMEDLANEVLSKMKMADRPSRFVLTAKGRNYKHPSDTFHRPEYTDILKVTAPVERGSVSFEIYFLDNHADEKCDWNWEIMRYSGDDWEGAVAFVDGFMSSGGRSSRLALFRCKDKDEKQYPQEVASWNLTNNADEEATRLARIRGALKALLGH